MAVFVEIGRSGIDAFDEMAAGAPAMAEPTHPGDPFLTGFASLKDRDPLVKKFHLISETVGHMGFSLLSGEEIR